MNDRDLGSHGLHAHRVATRTEPRFVIPDVTTTLSEEDSSTEAMEIPAEVPTVAVLAERSAAFRTLEGLPSAILVVDDGVIVFVNSPASKLLSKATALLVGARLDRILPTLVGTSGELAVDGRPIPLRYRTAAFRGRAPLAGCMAIVLEPATTAPALPFTVLEVLQLAAMGRRSVVVSVRERDGATGRVVVVDGEGWHAEDQRSTGLPALVRMAFEVPGARVSCEPLLVRPMMARTIEGGLDMLLLDAARLHDEHTPPRAHEVALGPEDEPRFHSLLRGS